MVELTAASRVIKTITGSSPQGFMMHSIKVIVIQAGFGDATLLELSDHHTGQKLHYLIDSGPVSTKIKHGNILVYNYFENFFEALMEYCSVRDREKVTIKLDGVMITHPDSDHVQGLIKLFESSPPNLHFPGLPEFKFEGPLLLTKAFQYEEFYLNVIQKGGFIAVPMNNFIGIEGFVNEFSFYFPKAEVDCPGVLYRWIEGEKQPVLKDKMISDKNSTSTLLVINNTAASDTRPLVSLNGDAKGDSILEFLDGKHPFVFKVPHHGSVHNSKPCKMTLPAKLRQLLSSKVLIKTSITEKVPSEYHSEMFLVRGGSITRAKLPLVNYYNTEFNDFFVDVSKRFTQFFFSNNKQKEDVLKEIDKLSENLWTKMDNLSFTDLYNLSSDLLEQLVEKYKTAKIHVCGKFLPTKVSRVLRIFEVLECNQPLTDNIDFNLSRFFYFNIRANVYFISSGDRYGHPHWVIINGIIAAAYEINQKGENYRCKILLTSGNNINNEKINDLSVKFSGWSQFVSIYYFAENTALCEIDLNDDQWQAKPGIIRWVPLLNGDTKELLNYNEAYGAKEMRIKRETSNFWYELQPQGFHNVWLGITEDTVQLFVTDRKTDFHVILQSREKSSVELKLNSCLLVYVFVDIDYPVSFTQGYYKLYFKDEGGNIHYWRYIPGNSHINFTPNFSEATHFIFHSPKSVMLDASTLLSLPIPTTTHKKTIMTNDFLHFISYKSDTIDCKELLDISVSLDFTSKLLNSSTLEIQLKEFLVQILNFSVDEYSSFVIVDSQLIDASVILVLPEKSKLSLKYKGDLITKVTFSLYDLKTIHQKVTLQLQQKGNASESIAINLTQFINYQNYVQSFPKYLRTFLNLEAPDKLKVYDAVILLLQSEYCGFMYMSNIAQAIVGLILEWHISYVKSTVMFVPFLTGPIVMSAHLAVAIPNSEASINTSEFSHPLCITGVTVVLPENDNMYISINGNINDVHVNVTCNVPEYGQVPEIDVQLIHHVSLDRIIGLLQIGNIGIDSFSIPLMSKSIKDVSITECGFTLKQCGQLSRLIKVSLGVEFKEVNQYLPPSFSNLKRIYSRVVITQPKDSFTQISFEAHFNFCVKVSNGEVEVPLTCVFTTHPVYTSRGEKRGISSYDFSVLLQTSTPIGTEVKDGISMIEFLSIFGLRDAMNQAQGIPLLHSLLNKVEVKRLLLGMNTSSKNINCFALDLTTKEWKLTDSILVNTVDVSLEYNKDNKWSANFETQATLCNKYFVMLQFQINPNSEAILKFKSSDDRLNLSKCLEVFGLGQMNDTPLVGQMLNVSITEASLSIDKYKDGKVTFKKGRLSLCIDAFTINSQLVLSEVKINVGFNLNKEDKYEFNFGVSGFINNKLYIDMIYDHATLTLCGSLTIASFKEASLSQVLTSLITDSDGAIDNNDVFKSVSSSPSVHARIDLKLDSGNFVMSQFVINIKNELKIGDKLSLTKLRFEYKLLNEQSKEQSEPQSVQLRVYVLAGELVSKETHTGAVLEFNLTTNSTGKKTIKAYIKPSQSNKPITLKSFLALLDINQLPDIPTIEGQELSSFFDISITRGYVMLSLPLLNIEAFQLEIETSKELIILDSPLIKLKCLSLQVNYNKSADPAITAAIKGDLTLSNIHLTLEGTKDKDGTVFKLAFIPANSTTDYQQLIKSLSPIDSNIIIPTNIGLPKQLNYFIAELVIKLLYAKKEKSFNIVCSSKLDWCIDLGFQTLTIKELGGSMSYVKNTKDEQFTVTVTGQFQFSKEISMSSKLQLGSRKDLVLNIKVIDPNYIFNMPTITDKLLGFHSTNFNSLLPDNTNPLKLVNCSIFINFTKQVFGLTCECLQGNGFFIAGNFSSDKTHKSYGYSFGIMFPNGFKFSDLVSPLAPIDELLIISKANCIIMSIEKVKVDTVVAKIKDSFSHVKSIDNFMDFKLEEFTDIQDTVPGMYLYCEFDFSSFKCDTLFSSVYKIATNDTKFSKAIITSFINKDPIKSVFRANIDNFTLLGLVEFSHICLVYSPSTPKTFQLNGTVSIKIDDKTLQFVGQFTCSDTQSKFVIKSDDEDKVIACPLGMTGITMDKLQLSLVYDYDSKDTSHTGTKSTQTLLGQVKFHPFNQQSDNVILKCELLFIEFKPTVVHLSLQPSHPLTISDLIATIFDKEYDIMRYIDIGFVNGSVYYAKLDKETTEINGVVFKRGYHISSDIEIFGKLFTIESDILPDISQVSIRGYNKAPLDFYFGKFTGTSDGNKVDENKGPAIVFTTDPNTTSISLEMGLILLKEPIGSVAAKYEYEGGIKKFIATITCQNSFSFIKNPTITFEWSHENGFQINHWKATGPIPNFMKNLLNYKDACGSLIDMVMKDGIHTKFNINIKVMKPSDSEKSIADIEITGTYDVFLVNEIHIASVPLPELPNLILPKKDDISLKTLPSYIINFFTTNMTAIVEQIVHHPERLAKIVALAVSKQLTRKALKTLFCRNVTVDNFDPEKGGEDPTDGGTDAKEAEDEFDKWFEDFLKTLGPEVGAGAGAAAAGTAVTAAGTAVTAAGEIVLDILGVTLFVLGAIVAIFGASDYLQNKMKKIKDKQKEIRDKMEKVNEKMKELLDINDNPNATFTPPNKLHATWNSIKEAQYHVKVLGTILTNDSSSIDEQISPSVVFYEDTISTNELSLEKEEFYNVMTLKVSVNATTEDQGHIYNGQVYTVDVHNVHPTLHPPTDLCIKYSHSTQQICLTANRALHGELYSFELIDANKHTLCHLQYKQPANSKTINCNFPHSAITSSSKAPFKVCGKSLGKVNTSISSSVPVESNSLSIADPIIDLQLSLPHFMENKQDIILQWNLPTNMNNINGVTCQVVDAKGTIVLLTTDYTSPIPTSGSFKLPDLVSELKKHDMLRQQSNNKPIHVMICVCTISSSEEIIDSIYTSKNVSSLLPPKNIDFHFQSSNDVLEINWDYEQESTDYGIQIKDHDTSQIMLSKRISVKKDPKISPGKVGLHIQLLELKDIIPQSSYTVQVTSISSDNETFDSLQPSSLNQVLKRLKKPILKEYKYIHDKDSISVSFTPPADANDSHKYLVILKQKNEVIYSLQHSENTTTVLIAMNTIIDKLQNDLAITCSVTCEGNVYFIPSFPSVFNNNLSCLDPPSKLEYLYKTTNEMITLSCTIPDGNYVVMGFINGDTNITLDQQASDDNNKITMSFESSALRTRLNIIKWKCFVQTSLTTDSTSQLPSPLLFLPNDIYVLDTPAIKSCTFIKGNAVLVIVPVKSIDNTSSYKLTCAVYKNESLLITISSTNMHLSNDNKLEIAMSSYCKQFSAGKEDWLSDYFPIMTHMSVILTAIGSNYYLSSAPSLPAVIKRMDALTNHLTYKYTPEEDTLLITSTVKKGNVTVRLGVRNKHNIALTKQMTSKGNNETIKVILFGQEIRDTFDDNSELIVFSQTIQDGYLPSEISTLSDHLKILSVPKVTNLSYDVDSTCLNIELKKEESENENYHYECNLVYEGSKKKAESFVVKHIKIKDTIVMQDMVSDWRNIIITHKDIKITIVLTNVVSTTTNTTTNEYYINSNKSVKNIINSPLTFTVLAEGGQITVEWERPPSDDITQLVNVSGCTIDFDCSDYNIVTIPMIYLFKPLDSIKAASKTFHVSITAHHTKTTEDCKDEKLFPSFKTCTARAPLLLKSNDYGLSGISRFDDGTVIDGKNIVGIKEMRIQHSTVVNTIQLIYRLDDGSTHTTPVYGKTQHDNNEKSDVIELRDDEYITGFSASYSLGHFQKLPRALCNLYLITKSTSGTTRHGPYGDLLTSKNKEKASTGLINFTGQVLSLCGMYNDHIDSLGFNYITLSREIFTVTDENTITSQPSDTYEGFDDAIVTHLPPIYSLDGLQLAYDNNTIYSIAPEFSDPHYNPTHGKEPPNDGKIEGLKIEYLDWTREYLVGMMYRVKDPQTCEISHLSFLTQPSRDPHDLRIKEYGPFAVGTPNSSRMHCIKGNILGFFGRVSYQNTISSLGVYFSLTRSELFGGNNGTYYDDHYPSIGAIRKVCIRYSTRGIFSFQIKYYYDSTDRGSSWGTLFGVTDTKGKGESREMIELEEREDVISVLIGRQENPEKELENEDKKGSGKKEEHAGEKDYVIAMLQLITMKKDGTIKKSAIFGNEGTQDRVEFKGRIVSFFGCSSQSTVNALGVYHV